MKVFWWLLVRGWVPDWLLRWKIRAGLQQMLDTMDAEEKDYGKRVAIEADFVRELRSVRLEADHVLSSPITEKALTEASWLEAPTSTFIFNTLLRNYAKQALTCSK